MTNITVTISIGIINFKHMKIILLLILSLFLLLSACDKDEKPDVNPVISISCNSQIFQTTINSTLIPVSITEDYNKSIIILGTENGMTKVLKIDSVGGLVWKKDFSSVVGKPASIIVLSDNSLVFATKLNNKHEYFAGFGLNNVFIQNGYNRSACEKSYELGSDNDNYHIKSGTNLVKLNTNGNTEWTKEIDRCYGDGNSLKQYGNNSFVLLTMKFYGRIPNVIYDANGMFQDTVNYSMDSNMIYLSKYSSDGKLNWQTEVNHVYNMQYNSLPTSLGIGITSSKIVVQSNRELISIDNGGTVVKREQMNNSNCSYELCSIGTIAQDVFISGNYMDNIYPYVHFDITKMDGSISWSVEPHEIIEDIGKKNIVTREFVINSNGDYYILKYYSPQGTLLWQYTSVEDYCCTFNCKEGITIAEQKSGSLQITRTDDSGNY